jgi:hypothetical protein
VRSCCGQVASIFLEAKTCPRPAPKKILDWHAIGDISRQSVDEERVYHTTTKDCFDIPCYSSINDVIYPFGGTAVASTLSSVFGINRRDQ